MEMPSSFLIGAIITIIIISGSFILGYKIIVGINEITAEKRAKDIYEEIYSLTDYLYYQAQGSGKVVKVFLKNDEILCFINREDFSDYLDTTSWIKSRDYDYMFLVGMLEEMFPEDDSRAKNYNIYYHKKGMQGKKFYVENLVPLYTFCANRTVDIYLENKGDYVSLERYTEE